MQAHYGSKPCACMDQRVGATVISEYLISRLEADEARKELARARKAERLLTDAEDTTESASGSAAAALSALESAAGALFLDFNTTHPSLQQFRGRPKAREDGGAVSPEPLLAVHMELGAADTSLSVIDRGLMAMLALTLHVCARKALADRSRRPVRCEKGHAIGAAGMDLKKHTWRSAGRPLICSPNGWTGCDAWFDVAAAVLDHGAYNERNMSLFRMHNGPGGDASKATGWLDREPSERELCLIMDRVCALEVRMRAPSGAMQIVTPHLLKDEEGVVPHYTPHSLKKAKISAYIGLRLHCDYAVEPGAHAGSVLERLSVAGAHGLARQIRPRGLAVALRYGRMAMEQSVMEIDALVAAAMRTWIAETGLRNIPRVGGWESVARWATICASRPDRPHGSIIEMRSHVHQPVHGN